MKKLFSIILLFIFSCIFVLPANAVQKDGYISIDRNSKHLGSRLHKEYVGYVYNITNTSNQDITIDGISIEDNVSSDVAYSTIKRSSLAMGAKTIGSGLIFALPTLTLSLIGAVLIAPIQMISNSWGNAGAKQDSKRYDKPYQLGILKSSSSMEFKILATKKKKPTVTVLYHLPDNTELQKLSY